MNITINARRVTITDSFKARIEKKLKKLDRFFDQDAVAVVTVSRERDRETVEVTIRAAYMVFRAEETTRDMFDSLEVVVDSLVRQIVKNKTRLEKRLRVNAFAPEYQDAVEPEEYRVVKTKRFAIKPMSVDEAILQMNLLEHEFFMFRQAETNDICVVYKRKNGDYGLIEPEIEE